MAITHSDAVKQAATNAVVDLIDVGGAGSIDICAGATVLVSITLAAEAFGAANSGGTATLAGTPSGTAVAAGTADNFKVYDGNDLLIFSGAVAVSGSDMNVNNTSIATDQVVTITSFTYDSAEA